MKSKLLSIVIPHYSEEEAEIFPLLSSISNQLGINHDSLEVIIVNDGGAYRLPALFFKNFPNLDLRFLDMEENKGPGVARQVGLDAVFGKYVMFCDADDILHSVGVLGAIIAELETHAPDMLMSPWLEEISTQVGYTYLNHDNESTWMHGKAFRTAFLRGNNIRFYPELRVHEDSYFLSLAFAHTQNVRSLRATSYVWKWSSESITRVNGQEYSWASIPEFNKAICLSMAELERRGLDERLIYKVTQFLLHSYFTQHTRQWTDPEFAEYLKSAEKSLTEEIRPFMRYFEAAGDEMIATVYAEERCKCFVGHVETETFEGWLCRLGLVGDAVPEGVNV